MDANGSGSGGVKKQEEVDGNDPKKTETKPVVRTLNRVPRMFAFVPGAV